jgi:hypothetical protein
VSFTALDPVDVWPLSASLRSHKVSERLVLRNSDKSYNQAIRDWRPMVALLKEIRERDWETGGIALVRLDACSSGAWERQSPSWALAVLPIVTNPLAYTFAGVICRHIEAGQLVAVDTAWPVCWVNWGKSPHFHLEIECRAKEKADAV